MIFKKVEKVLVIKLRYIGDVLLTVPVFRALREVFPGAHIAALFNAGTEEVLRGNPFIDEIILFNREIKKLTAIKRYASEINFLKDIRRKGFDMTVDLSGGDRAAIISFASGAKYRVGWHSQEGFIGKRYLYTHCHKPDGKKHIVLQNHDIVSQFGISTEDFSVEIHIPEDDRIFVKNILKKNSLKEDTKVIHIHPTSRCQYKCLKDECIAQIITWLLERDVAVIITSSSEEREMEQAKKILSLVPGSLKNSSRLINLCGWTTIKQLAAISELSDVFLGVDSAPMHIAAAVGIPVIALFGPSVTCRWRPWDNTLAKEKETHYKKRNGLHTSSLHTIVQRDWECVPCGKEGCNNSKISKCLEDIKPEEITAAIEKKLSR